MNNVDVEFAKLEKLIQKFYDTLKTLPNTSWIEIINKKKLVKSALNNIVETFVKYISVLEATERQPIYLFLVTQIAAL